MARFVANMPTGKPDDMVRFIAEDYLNKEGFKQITYKNEVVWKKGNGLVTGPQFIKLETMNGNVHLEAWIKTALLPGVYVGEMGVDGAYGVVLKQALKGRVDTLARLLYQPIAAPAVPGPGPAAVQPVQAAVTAQPAVQTAEQASPAPDAAAAPMQAPVAAPAQDSAAPVQPPMPQEGYPVPVQQPYDGGQMPYYVPAQPIPVAVHDPKDKAVLALIMGFVSILGCFVPIAGVIAGIVGIISAAVGRKSSSRTMATVGLVLSVVFLIISVLNWAAGIYINMARL